MCIYFRLKELLVGDCSVAVNLASEHWRFFLAFAGETSGTVREFQVCYRSGKTWLNTCCPRNLAKFHAKNTCNFHVFFCIWVFPKNRDTPKWMVYNGEPYENGMIWGYHHFRKHHMRWYFWSIWSITRPMFNRGLSWLWWKHGRATSVWVGGPQRGGNWGGLNPVWSHPVLKMVGRCRILRFSDYFFVFFGERITILLFLHIEKW